jgi:hypothetical protein
LAEPADQSAGADAAKRGRKPEEAHMHGMTQVRVIQLDAQRDQLRYRGVTGENDDRRPA